MQLSASTPSSDTNLAALLLGGETAAAAPGVAPGRRFRATHHRPHLRGDAVFACRSRRSHARRTRSPGRAPRGPRAPQLRAHCRPRLRRAGSRRSRASAPRSRRSGRTHRGHCQSRPAPRSSRSCPQSFRQVYAPTTNSSPLTPEQLPPVTPLAPQPLPTDLLTRSRRSRGRGKFPGRADHYTLGRSPPAFSSASGRTCWRACAYSRLRAAQLALSRPGSTVAVVTPPASSAPPATAPHAAPESSDAAPEILPRPAPP